MLKKLTVILLLAIYLFNTVGYTVFFQYFINNSDRKIVQQLDDHRYDDAQLSEIKVALSLPYLTFQNNYERINGQIEINGIHYNYVKRKISKDTLYLVCLPNFTKTKLYKEKNNYANEANDTPASNKNTAAKKSVLSNEYNPSSQEYALNLPLTTTQSEYCCNPISSLLHTDLLVQAQPPEIC